MKRFHDFALLAILAHELRNDASRVTTGLDEFDRQPLDVKGIAM
jgi:hypothetical protein